jgi:antitoxin CptB
MDATAQLDARRKQLVYRACHRGIKEMDIILGGFAKARATGMTAVQMAAFEAFMAETDRDLLTWFTGEKPLPNHLDRELFLEIAAAQAASIG